VRLLFIKYNATHLLNIVIYELFKYAKRHGNTYKQTIKDMQEEFEDIKGVIRRRRTDNTMAKSIAN
jgi:hypothetical protein